MGLNTSYYIISEVISLLHKYKQKIIPHNGDDLANKHYNMIYLNDNNGKNINKNKAKLNVHNRGMGKKNKVSNRKKNKAKQENIMDRLVTL